MIMIEYEKALHAATLYHYGQTRKYTGEPYVNHSVAVAKYAGQYFGLEASIVGLLHDVVEDTDCTISEIEKEFGTDVAKRVWNLTDERQGKNREERCASYDLKLAGGDHIVHTVKCADIINNLESIAKHDTKFAFGYIPEKIECLKVLTKAPKLLYCEAWRVLGDAWHTTREAETNRRYAEVMESTAIHNR